MAEDKILLEPRLRPFVVENALGTLLLLAAIPPGLHWMAGVSWQAGLISAAVLAIVAWAIYLRRFLRSAPWSIQLDPRGIEVHHRDGQARRFEWSEVRLARHERVYGLRWRLFGHDGSDYLLRDDGLVTRAWTRISTAIRARVEGAGGEVEIEDGLEIWDKR